jgi:SAM-dependent methyltransferase
MSSLPHPARRLELQPAVSPPRDPQQGAPRCAGCDAPLSPAPLPGRRYLSCAACGSAQSSEPIEDCQDGYYFHAGHGAAPAELARSLADLRARGLAPKGPDGARLLVFGAGSGECLSAASERGLDAHGLECSPAAVERGRRAGLRSRLWFLPRFEFAARHHTSPDFDRVWLPDLLEHFDHPGDVLLPAARLLRPGGLLFGTSLSPSSPFDAPQYHRQLLSAPGLSALLTRHGFEPPTLWPRPGQRLAFATRRLG